ncbi:MAG: hypothetical protein JWN00_3929 [Actinomycetia bacterium]|nr:hypothetical protein [Actinomycetes bacterium]
MLAERILTVRDIGDTELPYWTAASTDGVELLLEPGESLLYVGVSRVSELRPKQWSLDDMTLVVTDRRTAFLTRRFDTGGGWGGFGLVGLAVATSANAVSKRRAAKRSLGKVAIGQIRHEWLIGMSLRRRKALIGITDTYIDLILTSSAGPRFIELWGLSIRDESFARWLAAGISRDRVNRLRPCSSEDEAQLRRYIEGGQDAAHTGKAGDLGWTFPGDTETLIGDALPR